MEPIVTENQQKDDEDLVLPETENPCAALLNGESAYVPLPMFDDNFAPGSVAFPFAVGKRLFSMNNPWASDEDRRSLIVRYYRLAVGCTMQTKSQPFKEDMDRWLNSVVAPMLADHRKWYPVLAGASRVIRTSAKAIDKTTASGREWPRPKRQVTTATDLTKIIYQKDALVVIWVSIMVLWLLFWAFKYYLGKREVEVRRSLPTSKRLRIV